MFQLFKARPGAVWSPQIPKKISKTLFFCSTASISIYKQLAHSIQYHVSCLPEMQLEIKTILQAEKGKTFLQMMSLLSLLSQFLFLLSFFVVKGKSAKHPFDLLPVRGWQCSNLLTFNPEFG